MPYAGQHLNQSVITSLACLTPWNRDHNKLFNSGYNSYFVTAGEWCFITIPSTNVTTARSPWCAKARFSHVSPRGLCRRVKDQHSP